MCLVLILAETACMISNHIISFSMICLVILMAMNQQSMALLIYTNKYFVHNPKKNEKRQDYNQYYTEIKDKSAIEGLSTLFNRWHTTYLQDEDRKSTILR